MREQIIAILASKCKYMSKCQPDDAKLMKFQTGLTIFIKRSFIIVASRSKGGRSSTKICHTIILKQKHECLG